MNLTESGIAEVMVATGCVLIACSVLVGVLTAAIRFGLRPLLADWVQMRNQPDVNTLARQIAEMAGDIRQLKAVAALQLPAESLRTPQPRT